MKNYSKQNLDWKSDEMHYQHCCSGKRKNMPKDSFQNSQSLESHLIGQHHFENPFKELEVHFKGESLIERQAKMRQRAKELAEKRESERLKIVNEKNEQQWRQECVGKLQLESNAT